METAAKHCTGRSDRAHPELAFALRAALALLVAVAASCQPSGGTPPPPAPSACASSTPDLADLSPLFDCVVRDSNGGKPRGYVWGYQSGADVSVAFGPSNAFSGLNPSQGQPTRFQAGTHRGVFFSGVEGTTWVLGSGIATANSAATCKTSWNGNEQSVTVPGGGKLVVVADTASAIVPTIASNGEAVAELPGSFAVSADGAATYSISLRVPDGPAGVQPSFSLSYSSRGGDGMLGLGWSLSGLSQVARCPKTIASNGVAQDIQFDTSDELCLDGEHLRKLTSSDYRPESSPFTRVVPGAGDAAGPTEFAVYLPGGRIRHYGRYRNSTLEGQRVQIQADDTKWGTPPAESLSKTVRLAWHLASEEDRYGNSIQYAYNFSTGCDPNSGQGVCKPIYELYPSRASYTASGGTSFTTRSVRFVYAADRLGAPQPVHYSAGFAVRAPPLMTRIEMWAPNPVQEQLVRSYRLDYAADAVPGGATQPQAFGTPIGGVRRISAVRECDANGVCTKPTTFESAPHPDYDYEDLDTGLGFETDFAQTPFQVGDAASAQLWEMLAGDIDGDGRDDILYRTFPENPVQADGTIAANWTLRLSASPGAVQPFGSQEGAGLPTQFAIGGQRPTSPRVIDLDGDGRAEVLFPVSKRRRNGAAVPDVGGPDDDAPGASTRQFPYWRIYRWDASKHQLVPDLADPAETTNSSTVPYTINCVDLAACADGSARAFDIVWPSPMYLADLNGDGLPDLVRRDLDASRFDNSQHWLYRLNRGKHFDPSYRTLDPEDTTGWMQPVRNAYVANVDRSGRSSFLHVLKSVTRARATAVAFGAPSTTATSLSSIESASDPFYYLFVDVNGDGNADALQVPNSGEVLSFGSTSLLATNSGNGFRAPSFAGVSANDDSPIALNATDSRTPDPGIRVTDLDEDGLADLVLFGNNWPQFADSAGGGSVSRAQIMGRRSDGATLSRSAFLFAKDASGVGRPMLNGHRVNGRGYLFEQLLDVDGDGGTDFLSWPDVGGSPKPTLHLYRRLPRRFGELTKITSGFGVVTSIAYGATSRLDGPECQHPIVCTAKGMRVVATTSTIVPANAVSASVSKSTTYEYRGPRTNTTGRGWLGFKTVIATGVATGSTETTEYDPTPEVLGKYPYAFLPRTVTRTSSEFGPAYPSPLPSRRYEESQAFDYVLLRPETAISDARAAALQKSTAQTVEIAPGLPSPIGPGRSSRTELYAQSTEVRYDAYGNPSYMKAVNGTVASESEVVETVRQIDNDSQRWLLGLVRSETVTSTLSDGSGSTQTASRTVQHTYDTSTGALAGTTVPATPDTEEFDAALVRDARGRVTSSTVFTAYETRMTRVAYDELDGTYPREMSNALGQLTRVAFHPGLGVVAWVQNPNGLVTRGQSDTFGRPRRVDSPDGSWTRSGVFASAEGAYQAQTWASSGASAVSVFDALGRPILSERLRNSGFLGSVWSASATRWHEVFWDAPKFRSIPFAVSSLLHGGGPTLVVPAAGATATYDNAGRVVSSSAPGGDVRLRAYSGRTTTEADSVGARAVATLNGQGRLREHRARVDGSINDTSVHDIVTSYAYRPFGLLDSVTAPAASISFSYDSLGRRRSLTDSSNGVTKWNYDAFGELSNEARGSAGSTDYFHDALGRITATNSTVDGTTCLEYDQGVAAIGHESRAYRAAGTNEESYSFDAATGLPAGIHQVINGEPFDTKFNFQAGMLQRIDYPGGDVSIGYSYAPNGEVSTVTDGTTSIWTLGDRNPAGQLLSATLGNGLIDTRSYDPDTFRVHSLELGASAAALPISRSVYTYDSTGRLQTQTGLDGAVERFGYDAVGRIRSWTGSTFRATYDFDDAGNLRRRAGDAHAPSALTYDVDASRASIVSSSSDGLGYEHDDVGRLVRTYQTTDGTDLRRIDYTSFDLPKSISVGGQSVASFEYGPNQQRIRKTEPGSETIYVGSLLEIHRRDSGEERVHHAYGPEGLIAEIVVKDGRHSRLYVSSDRLGSTNVVTDDVGSVVSRTRFDPFGSRVDPANPTMLVAANPLASVSAGFTGHEQEDALGLVNMGGRVYDPRLGRFLSADPIGGLNAHAYVGGAVVNAVDPSGFEAIVVGQEGDETTVCPINGKEKSCGGSGGPTKTEYPGPPGSEGKPASPPAPQPKIGTRGAAAAPKADDNAAGAPAVEQLPDPPLEQLPDPRLGSGGDSESAFERALGTMMALGEGYSSTDSVAKFAAGEILSTSGMLGEHQYAFGLGQSIRGAVDIFQGINAIMGAGAEVVLTDGGAAALAYPQAIAGVGKMVQGAAALGGGAYNMWQSQSRATNTTRAGFKRKNATDWRRLMKTWDEVGYGDILSKENREFIKEGLTPVVDDAWVKYFPGDAPLKGQQLRMHHIGGYPITVPLPQTRHIDAHMPGGTRRNPGGPGTSG